jgi:hypothetical protein
MRLNGFRHRHRLSDLAQPAASPFVVAHRCCPASVAPAAARTGLGRTVYGIEQSEMRSG